MTMPADFAPAATCTTCRFKENKSNYWTAVLYFHHPNGSFIRVPQRAGHLATYPAGGRGPDGGIIIYYVQAPNEPTTTAFPKGFRMVTGNPMLREQTHFGASPDAWALTLRCWDVDALTTPFGPSNDHNASPGSPHDTIHLPRKVCPGGVRSQIFFPACWDGKNVDSPDHRSHVAFPMGDVGKDGVYQMPSKCPDSHPVRMPTLFYEVIWETNLFNDPELWPKDGSQPFVWSMGDPTGYGHHGDYMFGWEGDVLQRTMDTCVSAAGRPEECTVLTLQTDEEMSKCKLGPMVPEIVEGQYLDALPGCNPVQKGPASATAVPDCSSTLAAAMGFTTTHLHRVRMIEGK